MILVTGAPVTSDPVLVVFTADRVSELLEALTERATGVGQSSRPEHHESNYQDDQ